MISKLLAVLVVWLGWLATVVGLHFVSGVPGRMALSLVGIGISLFGMIVLLPSVMNRSVNR